MYPWWSYPPPLDDLNQKSVPPPSFRREEAKTCPQKCTWGQLRRKGLEVSFEQWIYEKHQVKGKICRCYQCLQPIQIQSWSVGDAQMFTVVGEIPPETRKRNVTWIWWIWSHVEPLPWERDEACVPLGMVDEEKKHVNVSLCHGLVWFLRYGYIPFLDKPMIESTNQYMNMGMVPKYSKWWSRKRARGKPKGPKWLATGHTHFTLIYGD